MEDGQGFAAGAVEFLEGGEEVVFREEAAGPGDEVVVQGGVLGFGFFGDVLPFDLAYGEAFVIEDGEAVGLCLAEQGAGFGQGVVYRKVKKRRPHEVAGGLALEALVFIEVAVFFGGGDDDESADEDEAPVTDFGSYEDEAQAGQLPDAGGYAGGAQARHAEVEQGAEDASAIHGEGGEQVEEGEHGI